MKRFWYAIKPAVLVLLYVLAVGLFTYGLIRIGLTYGDEYGWICIAALGALLGSIGICKSIWDRWHEYKGE